MYDYRPRMKNESSLHISLKNYYSSPRSQQELNVSNYLIDVVDGQELIEIQTGNFSKLKKKFESLLMANNIRLVYPLPVERWVVRIGANQNLIRRRKSPKRGNVLDIFNELIYILPFIPEPNFLFEVITIKDEILYIDDGKGSWRRRGWSVWDRKLIEIGERMVFRQPHDFLQLLPETLPLKFTTRELADVCGIRNRLAQRVAYCLFHLEQFDRVDKERNSWVYQRRGTGSHRLREEVSGV